MGPSDARPDTTARPVQLLVVDKTAVMPHIRERWERLAQHPDIEITLLLPSVWVENYREYRVDSEMLSHYSFASVIGRPALKGHELKGFYLGGVKQAFEASSPDVILMMEESFSVFGLQISRAAKHRAPGVPIIFYNNNIVSYDLPGFRLASLYRAIGRHVTPRMTLGLCVNERAREVLDETDHGVPSLELFYGIDELLFTPPTPEERKSIRGALGLPQDQPIVLYLGRLLEGKGIHTLIEAVARLHDAGRSAPHLLIVGSGPYETPLVDLASARLPYGSYEFRPAIEARNVPRLMKGINLHVLPSLPEINEQFGRVNVEAMLTGVLAVGSRTGGIPEVLGRGGVLFVPGDVDVLKEILGTFVADPSRYETTRVEGRQRALRLFSTAGFNSELRAILLHLAGGGDAGEYVREWEGRR